MMSVPVCIQQLLQYEPEHLVLLLICPSLCYVANSWWQGGVGGLIGQTVMGFSVLQKLNRRAVSVNHALGTPLITDPKPSGRLVSVSHPVLQRF